MGAAEQSNGLGWLLAVWVGIAAVGACHAMEDDTVIETSELRALPQCPAPLCPAPVCPAPQGPPAAPATGDRSPVSTMPTAPAARLDLNKASHAELVTLPGIGAKTADAIVRRRARSPFTHPRQLRRISGIGPRKYRKLKDLVTAGGK